jgi:hypothetical protein
MTNELVRVRTGEHIFFQKPLNTDKNMKNEMVNYWLAKQEPSGPRGYNFEQLKKEKQPYGMEFIII